MHSMPPYASSRPFPVADAIASSGINIPSSPRLTREDVFAIAARIRHHVEEIEVGDVFGGVSVSVPDATGVPDSERIPSSAAA
jgi:hypothetical protein